jgi:hypothetical protein
VVVRWQVYGSSGRDAASDEPVIARFQHRAPRDWVRNRRVKSVVDPERSLRAVNPHHFVYREGALAVDENGHRVALTSKPRFRRARRLLHAWLPPALARFDPYAGTDVSRRDVSVGRLRINHYPVKSREEFRQKARLKREKRRYAGLDYFAYHDRNDVHDPILLRYLPELQARCATLARAWSGRVG